MAEEIFNLPGVSLSELRKIIVAYADKAKKKDKIGLEDIHELTGLGKTTISSNNKFLGQVGIITGNTEKNVTELGNNLGHALRLDYEEDVVKFFVQIIKENDFLSNIITRVRIEKGISEEELAKLVLYNSKQTNSKINKTGARAIVEILKKSGLLLEKEDNKLYVQTTEEIKPTQPVEKTEPPSIAEPATNISITKSPQANSISTININIQLEIAATENVKIYENFFRSMRKCLFDNDLKDE